MNYYILATLYKDDAEYNEEGEVTKEATPLEGFHVNTDQPIEGAEEYVVEPTVPRQVFAGVETFFYSFPDEDTFAEFAPELYPPEPEPEVEIIEDEAQDDS